MLTGGIDHVAVLTNDLNRFVTFYQEVFEAEVRGSVTVDGREMVVLAVGPHSELNVFETKGEAGPRTPMFGRGRLDHLGLQAESLEAFDILRGRLMALGRTDGFVTDFGNMLSVFFRDPDGLECEVCVPNPDAIPGVVNPPGTPSARYHDD